MASREFAGVAVIPLAMDVRQLIALVAGAKLFVGNDSGPAHIASTLDRPTVVIFSETDPVQWGPRNARGKAVSTGATFAHPRGDKAAIPSISDLLKEGQEIIVQIAKEPLGQKGARITSHIALPGRFLVYMPTVDHIGVSRKIPSEEERSRLKRVLQTHRTGIPGGYIVRTAGDGRTDPDGQGPGRHQ